MTGVRRLVLGLGSYAALLLASVALLSGERFDDSAWRFVIALLPVPAAVAVVGVAHYRRMDELLQRIHLQALAVAFFGTLATVFSWGLLEGVGVPRLGGFPAFGILGGFYLVGLVWARSRYR
jgi:hypothetical protein